MRTAHGDERLPGAMVFGDATGDEPARAWHAPVASCGLRWITPKAGFVPSLRKPARVLIRGLGKRERHDGGPKSEAGGAQTGPESSVKCLAAMFFAQK